MNIFVLSEHPKLAAEYHCDKHVVKMVLESAQILCTALVVNGVDQIDVPYKATHIKHPCVLWAKYTIANWRWLYKLMETLNSEYKYRYFKDKNHLAYQKMLEYKVIHRFEHEWLGFFGKEGLTVQPKCMPEKYKVSGDIVESYRDYYKGDKRKIAKWTRRDEPDWYYREFEKIGKEELECLLS